MSRAAKRQVTLDLETSSIHHLSVPLGYRLLILRQIPCTARILAKLFKLSCNSIIPNDPTISSLAAETPTSSRTAATGLTFSLSRNLIPAMCNHAHNCEIPANTSTLANFPAGTDWCSTNKASAYERRSRMTHASS